MPFATILVPVPEAAVHKNDCPPSGEHDVRFSGKVFAMKTESETHFIMNGADANLRRGVPRGNPPHDL
jgi:hypothetical protein